MLILGIDPGLNATGYGLIEAAGTTVKIVVAGEIRPPRQQPLAARLAIIHGRLAALMVEHRPHTAVLEKIFVHHAHITTAAMMAHARGVCCLAVQEHGVVMAEYLPTRIKRAITGFGNASKEQVSRMVGQWLGYSDATWSRDATDALALAIAHAHMEANRQGLAPRAV